MVGEVEVDNLSSGIEEKMEVEGDTKLTENSVKEGAFLLGVPSYEDIGKGRMRCVATGHELLAKDMEAYGKSKACRIGLIDEAVAKQKPPLNMFKQDPISKLKLICKLTGYTINKTEEHIWKHITGKRFLSQLEKKENNKTTKKMSKDESSADSNKLQKKRKNNKKKNVDMDLTEDEENGQPVSNNNGCEPEEVPDFWTPPVGQRWDYDDGKDRWDPCAVSENGSDEDVDEVGEEKEECEVDEVDSADLSARTKRMSIVAVGPSSYASAKKKRRATDNSNKEEIAN